MADAYTQGDLDSFRATGIPTDAMMVGAPLKLIRRWLATVDAKTKRADAAEIRALPLPACDGVEAKRGSIMFLARTLTDPENQPHQWTGNAEALARVILPMIARLPKLFGDQSSALADAISLPDDAPKWSSQVPTVAGWYWVRPGDGCDHIAAVFESDERGGGLRLDEGQKYEAYNRQVTDNSVSFYQWSGPIPEPVGE